MKFKDILILKNQAKIVIKDSQQRQLGKDSWVGQRQLGKDSWTKIDELKKMDKERWTKIVGKKIVK